MTISKRQLEEEVSRSHALGFVRGKDAARVELSAEYKAQQQQLALEAVRAAVTLMQESSKMMSRAGYMLGKAMNKEGF